ncbi:hypothetical protein [Lacisediminihabitans sp. H27-G8]|uniref:hypothetical protein n=1 Tax=Lacisediminihabitans sp. H27-G8 TaxID=3111909 RepID=UPI0038FCE5C7
MKDNPHVARLNARARKYNNSADERAAVTAVDEAVFDKVRQVEAWTVENANTFLAASQGSLSEAAQLSDEMSALRNDLDYTDRVAPREAGARYAVLQSRVAEVNAKLDRIDRESEWLEEKAADPYANYLGMLEKFPVLRPDL